MDIANAASTPTQALAIQLNKNTFGLAPVNPQMPLPTSIANGSTTSITVSLKVDSAQATPANVSGTVQTAIKNMASVYAGKMIETDTEKRKAEGKPPLAEASFAARKAKLTELMPATDPQAVDMVCGMLDVDPSKRLSVEGALKHPWMAPFTRDYDHEKSDVCQTLHISLDDDVKQERLQKIHRIATEHALFRSQRFVGRREEVLVEMRNTKNPTQVMGRTETNRQVFFEGDIDELRGKLVVVEITEARPYSLTGERIHEIAPR